MNPVHIYFKNGKLLIMWWSRSCTFLKNDRIWIWTYGLFVTSLDYFKLHHTLSFSFWWTKGKERCLLLLHHVNNHLLTIFKVNVNKIHIPFFLPSFLVYCMSLQYGHLNHRITISKIILIKKNPDLSNQAQPPPLIALALHLEYFISSWGANDIYKCFNFTKWEMTE